MKPIGGSTAGKGVDNLHGTVYDPRDQVGGSAEGGCCHEQAEQKSSFPPAAEIEREDSQDKKDKEADSRPDGGVHMNLREKRLLLRQVGSKYRCQEKEPGAQEKKKHSVPFFAARAVPPVKKRQEAEKQIEKQKKTPDEKFPLPVICSSDRRKVGGKQSCFPAQRDSEKGDSKVPDKIKCHMIALLTAISISQVSARPYFRIVRVFSDRLPA